MRVILIPLPADWIRLRTVDGFAWFNKGRRKKGGKGWSEGNGKGIMRHLCGCLTRRNASQTTGETLGNDDRNPIADAYQYWLTRSDHSENSVINPRHDPTSLAPLAFPSPRRPVFSAFFALHERSWQKRGPLLFSFKLSRYSLTWQ